MKYLETIQKIDEAIESIQQEIQQKQIVINNLNQSKMLIQKTFDICPSCCGKGKVYKPCNDGDPYHKSSDDWTPCNKCKGTGRFFSK